MRVGPQRSTTTIRTATIVDYQPGTLLFLMLFRFALPRHRVTGQYIIKSRMEMRTGSCSCSCPLDLRTFCGASMSSRLSRWEAMRVVPALRRLGGPFQLPFLECITTVYDLTHSSHFQVDAKAVEVWTVGPTVGEAERFRVVSFTFL